MLKKIRKNINNFISTDIEWILLTMLKSKEDMKEIIVEFLEILENDDDVQNVYTNVILKKKC